MLIGAKGYLGSRLYARLRSVYFNVLGIDWRLGGDETVCVQDYRTLTEKDLKYFDTIIWMAGHSSVLMVENDKAGAFENNVSGLLKFVHLLKPSQRFIYASSASLYSDSQTSVPITTEDIIGPTYENAYDLSKYVFDKIISTSSFDFCGLRLGTVCGVSSQQRDELLLNSMVKNAIEQGIVKVSNPLVYRSVLALDDFVNIVEKMVEHRPNRGFYNLVSFSAKIGEFAKIVADKLEAKIVYAPDSYGYNYLINSDKIERVLNGVVFSSINDVIDNLAEYYKLRVLVNS